MSMVKNFVVSLTLCMLTSLTLDDLIELTALRTLFCCLCLQF